MDTRKLIYNTFLKPFENKQYGNIGVELEFPLINLMKLPVEVDVAKGMFDYFLEKGFKVELEENGQPLFITNEDGDCLSYDNSYNNFEFAMNYGDNLCDIADRFYKLLDEVKEYFRRKYHALLGLGINPYRTVTRQCHVDFSTYNMVDEYLHKFGKDTRFPDFPAYLSSAQTHLDIPLADVPKAYTLFAKLDFVRGRLFSNSPDFKMAGFICFRDFLWEQSAFSKCPNITGKVDGKFETSDDIVDYIMKKGMFNRKRDGKYEIFEPVGIEEYFAREDAEEADIDYYLSFKNVEITRRGTLEIRSDCAQMFEEVLAPAAFNLGIAYNMDEANRIVDAFFEKEGIDKPNSYLREAVVEGESDKIASEESLRQLEKAMLDCAAEGLKRRGKGEEMLLNPVFLRWESSIECPGKEAYKIYPVICRRDVLVKKHRL